MKIPSRAAASLAELTETFDDPDIDIGRSLGRFADQVRSAVPSYLGVSVEMMTADTQRSVDAMEDSFVPGTIRSSVKIPTSTALGAGPERAGGAQRIALILYAASPGALIDLAADLAWLTSLPLSDFALDQHLTGPESLSGSAAATSVVNQAIGVLLARGRTPEEAEADIDGRAVRTGLTRQVVATAILAETETSLEDP